MDYFRVRIVTEGKNGKSTKTQEYPERSLAEAHCRKVRTRSYTREAVVEIWGLVKMRWVNYSTLTISPFQSWVTPLGYSSGLKVPKLKPPPVHRSVQISPYSVEESMTMDLSLELSHNGMLAS